MPCEAHGKALTEKGCGQRGAVTVSCEALCAVPRLCEVLDRFLRYVLACAPTMCAYLDVPGTAAWHTQRPVCALQ